MRWRRTIFEADALGEFPRALGRNPTPVTYVKFVGWTPAHRSPILGWTRARRRPPTVLPAALVIVAFFNLAHGDTRSRIG